MPTIEPENLVAVIGQEFQSAADQQVAHKLAEVMAQAIAGYQEEVKVADLTCALAIVVANHCEAASEPMFEVENREMVLFEVIGGLIRRLLLRPDGPHVARRNKT
jgi:hypothetical protein